MNLEGLVVSVWESRSSDTQHCLCWHHNVAEMGSSPTSRVVSASYWAISETTLVFGSCGYNLGNKELLNLALSLLMWEECAHGFCLLACTYFHIFRMSSHPDAYEVKRKPIEFIAMSYIESQVSLSVCCFFPHIRILLCLLYLACLGVLLVLTTKLWKKEEFVF